MLLTSQIYLRKQRKILRNFESNYLVIVLKPVKIFTLFVEGSSREVVPTEITRTHALELQGRDPGNEGLLKFKIYGYPDNL